MDETWIAGLDLGFVSDATALSIVSKTVKVLDNGKRENHYAVRHLQRWIGTDYLSIAEQLRPMFEALPTAPTLVADETGVGVGVMQILRRAKLPVRSVVGITITAGHHVNSRPQGGWNVPKRELIAFTQSALQAERLQIAPQLKEARTLRRELATFKVKVSLAGTTESYEAWRSKDTDDLCLSVCMACWYGEYASRRLTADSFFIADPRPQW
jgi:hypothetical protein